LTSIAFLTFSERTGAPASDMSWGFFIYEETKIKVFNMDKYRGGVDASDSTLLTNKQVYTIL
jgi:hypothetical protein